MCVCGGGVVQVLDPASMLTVRKIENTDVKRLKVLITECGEL